MDEVLYSHRGDNPINYLEAIEMKKTYKAIATVTDGEREWDVVIYSLYKTIEEANDGISRFAAHGYNIVKAWIE